MCESLFGAQRFERRQYVGETQNLDVLAADEFCSKYFWGV